MNQAICGGNPCAAGSINSSPIPAAQSDGLIASGSKQANTFGEAQIDLRLIFQPNDVHSLGSAMLKSRSSDSFTSALKDFVAPVGINLQNCGKVIIRKDTLPDETDQNFNYTKNFAQDDDNPLTTPPTPDTATSLNFQLNDNDADGNPKVQESRTFNNVLFGTGKTVEEVNLLPAWQLKSLDCSASSSSVPATDRVVSGAKVTFKIDADTDVLDCTYTNEKQLGALAIQKNSTKGGTVLKAGAVFSYNGSSVTDNGTGDEDPAVGKVCVSGLTTGNYTVNETSPPPGYGSGASDPAKTVTVVTGSNCTAAQYPTGAAVATFTNPPLADIQVRFRDGGSGETRLDPADPGITCNNATGATSTADTANWDDTKTVTGIEAGATVVTVTCTIPIDP